MLIVHFLVCTTCRENASFSSATTWLPAQQLGSEEASEPANVWQGNKHIPGQLIVRGCAEAAGHCCSQLSFWRFQRLPSKVSFGSFVSLSSSWAREPCSNGYHCNLHWKGSCTVRLTLHSIVGSAAEWNGNYVLRHRQANTTRWQDKGEVTWNALYFKLTPWKAWSHSCTAKDAIVDDGFRFTVAKACALM